ncbi:MAG: HDOD domain-containing protein [Magnetococcales bacterium]|nr:HDOD domain-containing protein [Magnetococcales bacterium]
MGKKTEKNRIQLAKKITYNVSIPSRPKVMLEVSRLSESHEPDWRSLSFLIRGDMALAAAILKKANSSLSKKEKKIASVEKAIIVLGWQETRELLEEMFFTQSLTRKKNLANEIREQGVLVADTAMWLVRRIANISPHFRNGCYPLLSLDQTYISALFLNCGMIAMEQYFDDYASFIEDIRENRNHNLIEAENRTFGTNHALAGYLMSKDWQLPKPVCNIILDHHKAEIFNQPGEKVKNLGFTVLHGIILIVNHLRGEISLKEWELMEDKILSFFDITHKDIEKLANDLQKENLEMSPLG